MYFSNIANSEIQHFHETIGADFSISLTDLLESDLFIVEPITSNIYRVYPLFYCNQIVSSNPSDKILDNRCLILQQNTEETYLAFMTNKSKSNIILQEDVLNIKTIEDNLTDEEYNALIYCLRRQSGLSGDLNFENSVDIVGAYGTYQLGNSENQLRNDTGFIVNDKIKSNPLTVKLVNPFFKSARYVLTFTVRSLTGANVCEENEDDFISVDTFNVELVEDYEVAIPVTGYVNDSVLDYDVTVSISFDTPEIVNEGFKLNLTVSGSSIVGTTATLKAKLTSTTGASVEGYSVKFSNDERKTTDSNGECTTTTIYRSERLESFWCSCIGLFKMVTTYPVRDTTVMRPLSYSQEIGYEENVIITGWLGLQEQGGLSNKTIRIILDNIEVGTCVTDNNGNFRYSFTGLSVGNHMIQAIYDGDYQITGAGAGAIVNVPKKDTNIILNMDESFVDTDTITASIGLKNTVLDTFLVDETIELYINDVKTDEITTTNELQQIILPITNLGAYKVEFRYAGDSIYKESTVIKNITYKHSTSVDIIVVHHHPEYNPPTLQVGANLLDNYTDERITTEIWHESILSHDSEDNPIVKTFDWETYYMSTSNNYTGIFDGFKLVFDGTDEYVGCYYDSREHNGE